MQILDRVDFMVYYVMMIFEIEVRDLGRKLGFNTI